LVYNNYMEETENKYEIRNDSQELFIEAIKTIPTIPQYFELSMRAHGILPVLGKTSSVEEYISLCEKNRVVPFSEVKYAWGNVNDGENHFAPIVSKVRFEPLNYLHISDQLRKKARDLIIKGGKMHILNISSDQNFGGVSEAFDNLKGEFLNIMKENGYEISSGVLYLNSYYNNNHYEEGMRALGTMLISNQGLSLERNFMPSDEESKEGFLKWFDGLKKKSLDRVL